MKRLALQSDSGWVVSPANHTCASVAQWSTLEGFIVYLSWRKSGQRHTRHSQLNDLIWKAVKRAQIPATKEAIGLSRIDGKRPDGATWIPWKRGKPLTWNVTVPDTYAASHLGETAESAGAAANKAGANKISKYSTLAMTHHYVPISVETGGPWNPDSSEFIFELGNRISQITLEPLETQFLFQRLSISRREERTSIQKHVLSKVISFAKE